MISGLLMSVVGMFVLLVIGFIFSKHKKQIRPRVIFAALAIQFCFGGFVLFVPFGNEILLKVSTVFVTLLNYSRVGTGFLFGDLINIPKSGFIFALQVLPVIIYLASLISVLYYIGVMKLIIRGIGGALHFLIGTSQTESLSAAANIFVGQTEAPLTVKPYIAHMTDSELFTIMTGGLASVAGSVLAGYIGLGIPAPYLIAASFMAAPGGLLFSKLLYPETAKPLIDVKNEVIEDSDKSANVLEDAVRGASDGVFPETEKSLIDVKNEIIEDSDQPANVLEAAARGASDGVFLVLNVGAMLLAFLSIIALMNGILTWCGELFNFQGLTLEYILGVIFRPLAWVIGVPWKDADFAGSLIGIKIISNEFVGYLQLSADIIKNADGTFEAWKNIAPITGVIVSFALCGFANLGSIAILIGGLGVMAPSRRSDVARLGLRAVLAGALSNLMSATIAGFFFILSGGHLQI